MRKEIEYVVEALDISAQALGGIRPLFVLRAKFGDSGNRGEAFVINSGNLYIAGGFLSASPSEAAAKFLHEATHILNRTWDNVYFAPGRGFHEEGGLYEDLGNLSTNVRRVIESRNGMQINSNLLPQGKRHLLTRRDGKSLGS